MPTTRDCPECGFNDRWQEEDGRGNILCECSACPDCGIIDAYGFHNHGCVQLDCWESSFELFGVGKQGCREYRGEGAERNARLDAAGFLRSARARGLKVSAEVLCGDRRVWSVLEGESIVGEIYCREVW